MQTSAEEFSGFDRRQSRSADQREVERHRARSHSQAFADLRAMRGRIQVVCAQSRGYGQAAAAEVITPGEDFFKALRARIARGPERAAIERVDESWAAALLLTARQLIPAMAMLLLIIIGATLVSNIPESASNKRPTASNQIPRRERIVFNDVYDVPAPTADDVLETLVAVEEKENAK